ncbi:tautomerase family protein [Pseudonocardia sp. CA-107938]|uniref:tautomerase family protein n=1 Tax=Pseudonocardia sp. CA-107938 TaxID=3240021 RepID=UPI003D8AA67E
MPHLTVSVAESQLAGREAPLISALTDAVAAVYGEWARPLVVVQLVGLPAGRWAVGGRVVEAEAAPEVRFGIRAGALTRPDGPDIARRLVAAVTDAVAAGLGERLRKSVLVELAPQADDLVGVGGALVSDAAPE